MLFVAFSDETAGHLGAVLATFFAAALLLFVAIMYVKCRLNALLWYRNHYGEVEINGMFFFPFLLIQNI